MEAGGCDLPGSKDCQRGAARVLSATPTPPSSPGPQLGAPGSRQYCPCAWGGDGAWKVAALETEAGSLCSDFSLALPDQPSLYELTQRCQPRPLTAPWMEIGWEGGNPRLSHFLFQLHMNFASMIYPCLFLTSARFIMTC